MPLDYFPVSFHFRVDFTDISSEAVDVQFQSVSGLEVNFETETIKEGGENRFQHILPVRTQYSTLSLKRGVLKSNQSAVSRWCIDAFQRMSVVPINLVISLLNENHDPLMNWRVYNAWPKRWSFAEMNAEKSEVFIETLELQYNGFVVF